MNIFHDSSLRNNEHKCWLFLNESQDGFIFNYFEKVMYLEYSLREPGYTRTLFEEKKKNSKSHLCPAVWIMQLCLCTGTHPQRVSDQWIS